MALSGCNHSSGDPQSDFHQAVVCVLFVGVQYSADPVSGCCVPVFPPFPSVWSSSASCFFPLLRTFWGRKEVKVVAALFTIYKKCCHHPMKRPAHGAFNGKGGSSSSSFAKLCSGSFRVGSGISPQKTRTFYLIFRSFHPK